MCSEIQDMVWSEVTSMLAGFVFKIVNALRVANVAAYQYLKDMCQI
jgi:hypothetical protein